MRVFGLDLSNFTTNVPVPGSGTSGGFITDELVAGWMAAGFTHAIIGTQWPEVAKHQLEVCHRGGMTLDLYSWLDWQGDITEYLRTRLQLANGYPIGIHWLDAEQSRGSLSPVGIDDEIAHAVSLVEAAGQKPGIYTAAWWWPDNTDRSAEFHDLPLWHAAYTYSEGKAPAQADAPDFGAFKTYGGWEYPTMWQYAGSVKTLGANLDLNVMDYDPAERLEEPIMKRHNATAPSLVNLELNGPAAIGLKDYFDNPPPACSMVRLELYLFAGDVQVLDADGAYAGQAGWGGQDADPPTQIDVMVGDGLFNLTGNGKIAQLGLVGYWP